MSSMIRNFSRLIAKKLGWRVDHARKFAVALLTEVNDHETASELLDIIERKK